jgi:hypothetical protein
VFFFVFWVEYGERKIECEWLGRHFGGGNVHLNTEKGERNQIDRVVQERKQQRAAYAKSPM